jgi:hypothetical protein
MALSSVTHISALAMVRRTRLLPFIGRVMVHESQKVKASDTIATCALPGRHVRIDLRQALNIKLVEKISPLVEKKAGDTLQKGDIIAQTKGMLRRIVRAPSNGYLISIDNGIALLEIDNQVFELKAGFSGFVHEVIPEKGAIVEYSGALIQGVWGNGKSNMGILASSVQDPGVEFTRTSLDVSMRGGIWLGSFCAQADALQACAELPLRGLILASMTADLIPIANSMPFPIILTEGFGQAPMNNAAYKLLATNDKREVSISAAAWDRNSGERPEIYIPLPSEGNSLPDIVELMMDQRVRVNMPPYTGKIGTIVRLHPSMTRLDNGVQVLAADVQFENANAATIPIANLDPLN